jgi:hypothetical protein
VVVQAAVIVLTVVEHSLVVVSAVDILAEMVAVSAADILAEMVVVVVAHSFSRIVAVVAGEPCRASRFVPDTGEYS